MVPSYRDAIEAGKPIHSFKGSTLADGLAVPVVGSNAFKIAKACVDSSCVVSEQLISIAMLRLIEKEKMVAEGGGAIALAAILPGGPLFGKFKGKKVVLPICGGNVDTPVLGRVLERGLAADHRLIRFTATVSDRPGGIAAFSRTIADAGASIKVR
jgi:threonine dehydratase